MKQAVAITTPRWLRIGGFALLVAFLIWIPIEDVNENWVIVLAGVACAWLGARHLSNKQDINLPLWLHYVFTGLIAGLAITPVALLLMAFKTGIHGHGTPDFTPQQMARVVELTPVWAAVGLLVGLGASILNKTRTK